MKQPSLRLCLISAAGGLLVALVCQVQGGIITNQQTLTLPAEIADAQTTSTPDSVGSDGKNNTRTGRVIYTAPYSNVRIASKEPKSLKYFPLPVNSRKPPATVTTPVGPYLRTSTSTTTTTTTPKPQPVQPVRQTLPEIVEIVEETEPNSGEVVTEGVTAVEGDEVTEQNERL